MTRNLNPDDQPLCADDDPEMWFPEPNSGENSVGMRYQKINIERAVEALRICSLCPLQKSCIEYAMESIETVHYGIYGGTLPMERQRAISAGDISNTKAWQAKIRAKADLLEIPVPSIAKRERPEALINQSERSTWVSSRWSLPQQAS